MDNKDITTIVGACALLLILFICPLLVDKINDKKTIRGVYMKISDEIESLDGSMTTDLVSYGPIENHHTAPITHSLKTFITLPYRDKLITWGNPDKPNDTKSIVYGHELRVVYSEQQTLGDDDTKITYEWYAPLSKDSIYEAQKWREQIHNEGSLRKISEFADVRIEPLRIVAEASEEETLKFVLRSITLSGKEKAIYVK